MNDRERMLDDLDAYRWHLLAQLADEAEENGRELEAKAWRWLLKWKRWPTPRKGERYGWIISNNWNQQQLMTKSERIQVVGSDFQVATTHETTRKAFEYAVDRIVEHIKVREYEPLDRTKTHNG